MLNESGVPVLRDENGDSLSFQQMNPNLWLKNAKYFGEKFTPGEDEIHVLVVVPSGVRIDVGETVALGSDYAHELSFYQQRGKLIQSQQQDYCKQILDKIDSLYKLETYPLPFICVEASSGMGKSQLAFALGGRRPWFYWLAIRLGIDSQRIYKNFESISGMFDIITLKDGPTKQSQIDIFDPCSSYYMDERLWTYGFIFALLKHCSLKTDQSPQMIRFEGKKMLHVDKCDRATVSKFCISMKNSGKLLPFFILDEMALNSDMDDDGKNKAAFQRNVFRACGLVVVVMGTDAKITNLVGQLERSFKQRHSWMTIVSRFPSIVSVAFEDGAKQTAWNQVTARFPVLLSIVKNSRGRFSRFFVDSVVKFAMESSVIILSDLLDKAFVEISQKTQIGKGFMMKQAGKYAQLMAISYTNTAFKPTQKRRLSLTNTDYLIAEPAQKKRRLEVGTECMHLHFANLVDEQLTDVDIVANGELLTPSGDV